jgi:predicted DNA-binding transcriptional regulator YafY
MCTLNVVDVYSQKKLFMSRTDSSTSSLRLNRIFLIHSHLRSLAAYSADDLADFCRVVDLEANARKIRQDIQFLRELGAPIPRGNKHAKFRYEKPFSLLQAIAGVQMADLNEVLAYLRQFSQAIPRAAYLELDKVFLALERRIRTTDALGDPRLQFEKIEYTGEEYLTPILDYIVQGKAIEFDYEPYFQPPKKRTVFPLFLKEFNNRWYVIAYDQQVGAYQNFALDRIKSKPKISGWKPAIEKLPDPASYFQDLIGVTHTGLPVRVVVRVQKMRAMYIRTKPWHPSQEELAENNSCIDFAWLVQINKELKTRILELGSDAEVIEPDELRQDIVQQLETALARYRQIG